jgi:Zn-dependent protease with chaperone function
MMTAQLCLDLNDLPGFKNATEELRRFQPGLMQTHYCAAIAAAVDEHWIQAEDEIRAAGRLGLPTEAVRAFLDKGVGTKAMGWRLARYALVTLAVWIGGMVVMFLVGFGLSALTMRQAGRVDSRAGASPLERQLRRVYRLVLNLAGVYYYVSLPIVLALVVAISAALIYGILMLGYIPVKLLLLLVIGVAMTLWAAAKSLFVKVKAEDPGRSLGREEAPELWELTQEVARTLDTRPIDEIRITPGTDLAVYERGRWQEKLRDQAQRVLILGAATLDGFQIDHFRCVLAHEYGHFSHRDTAGGEIAMRVRNDMFRFYRAMAAAGQATRMNAAFHFLRVYNFLFRRISHGASRLQEILADRVAAQAFGALAFEAGLRHVIGRELAFKAYANREIKAAIEARRPLQNLYQMATEGAGDVAGDLEQTLSRKTSRDDSHPSPADRFRLVSGLTHPSCPPRSGEVWGLFADRAGLEREMMVGFEQRVDPYRSVEDPARGAGVRLQHAGS